MVCKIAFVRGRNVHKSRLETSRDHGSSGAEGTNEWHHPHKLSLELEKIPPKKNTHKWRAHKNDASERLENF